MPLVTIELNEKIAPEQRRAIADAVHEGLVEGLGMDREDRFQVIHPLPEGHIICDPSYLGADRRDVVMVRIQMVHMFDPGTKERMFRAVARHMEAAGVRPDDVFVSIVEVGFEDWYPGARTLANAEA